MAEAQYYQIKYGGYIYKVSDYKFEAGLHRPQSSM